MSKSFKWLFVVISAIAFALTCVWYYMEKGWEPLSAIVISLGALITSLTQSTNIRSEQEVTENEATQQKQNVENHNNVHIHTIGNFTPTINSTIELNPNSLDNRKRLTNILFVDDDTKFKVVSILKTAGWINTKAVKDIGNLDEQYVKAAHIIFVDVQGVGKLLQTKDDGLGLALILKRKYPKTFIIIYSAQTEGDRFHEALRKADASLPKNAEPYEFQQLVEQFSEQITT